MKHHLFLIVGLSLMVCCKDRHHEKGDLQQQEEEKVRKTPAFTDTTACIFSEITYCSDPQQQLDKYLPGWKITWNPLAIKGNHAFVATDGQAFVIAFRGSLINFTVDAFNNWIYNDLNVAVQDKWPYCSSQKASISQGSFIGWQNLESMKDRTSGKTLWAFLSENIKDSNPLYLTGHSLGGNLATVYASYLLWKFNEAKHPKSNIDVITFAAPAAGNSYFANEFNENFPRAIRVENTNDIVPKFPCSSRIRKLASLYAPLPAADSVVIGYKHITTTLSGAFLTIGGMLDLAELTTSFSGYSHTCGEGKVITIPLSGKNIANQAGSWFAEAGYQHGMSQYAAALGAPVIKCEGH